MDYTYILNSHIFEINKLLTYGFIKESDTDTITENIFTYRKDLKKYNLYIQIQIKIGVFLNASVYDKDFNEDYTLYSINGKTTVTIEVEELMKDIIAKCTKKLNIKEDIVTYLEKKYQITSEKPWEKYYEYVTLKTKNSKKWFAVILQVQQKKLDSSKKDNFVDIINIKLNPGKIEALIDNEHYFLAYHMNKKSWITIILDCNTNLEELYELVDESYHLVEKDNEQQVWIIPCNPAFYDIETVLENEKKILWKQIGKINIDDLILIYMTNPIYQVKYICQVTKINLPYHFEDDNLKMNKVFEMKLLLKINHNKIDLNFLKENGLSGVRNQRKVSKELYQRILSYNLE